MSLTIYASAGADEYITVNVADATGQELTSCTWQIGLSTTYGQPPETWQTPTVVSNPTATTAQVQLLSGSLAPGVYWPWIKCGDVPETIVAGCVGSVTVQ